MPADSVITRSPSVIAGTVPKGFTAKYSLRR